MVQLSPVAVWRPNSPQFDPTALVCPVYDTLSPDEIARYRTRPFNAARFVVRSADVPRDRYVSEAGEQLRQAIATRAYVQEATPSLYVYGIQYQAPPDIAETLPHPDRRPSYLLLGVVGTLNAIRPDPADIALHELVFNDRVEERRRLGAVTGMQFAPIVAGYSMPGHEVNDLLEAYLGLDRRRLSFNGTVAPTVEAELDGVRHRLWRIDSAETIDRVLHLLKEVRVLVLDGHHRISAQLQGARAEAPAHPLVMLVEGRDRGLLLRPWHRLVPPALVDEARTVGLLRRRFPDVVDLRRPLTAERLVAELASIRTRRRHGFIAIGPETAVRIEGIIAPDAGADFALLHRFLEEELGLDPHRLTYARSPRAALEAMRTSGGMAFLLPSTSVDAVERLAFDHHRVMVQKSTMFLPKVVDGLLFAPWGG